MNKKEGMTVNQLIEALELFRDQIGGDIPVLTADYDTVGNLGYYDGWCQFQYSDLNRIPLRPYDFEQQQEEV